MDLSQRSSSGAPAGAHDDGLDRDRPYGPRSLGATTDGLGARPLGGVASSSGPITWSVQRLIDASLASQATGAGAHAAAAHGTRDAATALPHGDAIQRSFGRHDVSGIEAHVGGAAREGAAAMGAQAFAAGNHVAFADAPSLHTAAHEAAHVVQQRAGVQLLGGVGEAGDVHERHADEVADKVVRGESAEELLDEHAPAGGAPAQAPAAAPIQKLIATTPNQLAGVLLNQDPAQVQITAVGQQITTYNAINDNVRATKLQNQINQLRVLDRACHTALNTISANQVDLRHDARAQLLHQVLQQSETEHRAIVDAVLAEGLNVDCFDAQGTTNQNGDIGQATARQLWARIMAGGGKIKILGNAPYPSQVRSWLTKLMDTVQGRRLLQYLDAGNDQDHGTNVYLGEQIDQLPDEVKQHAQKSTEIKDTNEAVAQPLLNVDTRLTRSQQQVNGSQQINNPNDLNREVLGGNAPAVRLNGDDYNFGGSSGSFIAMVNPGQFRVATGNDRNNAGTTETPEIYQPDWILLGHELGHSANMRRGATTEGKKMQNNPTDVFAETFTGNHNRDDRQGRWYGGSEEYINIIGHENELRQEGGLDQRGGHTAAVNFESQRRKPALMNALNPIAWANLYQPGSPTEQQRIGTYNTDKLNLEQRFELNPSDPQHVQDAQNLCQQMVAYFTQRIQQRNATMQMVNQMFNGDAARNALLPGRTYEARLQQQYDHVKNWITNRVIEHPNDPLVYQKASRIVYFCQRWVTLRDAHDQAAWTKQFKLKAWWDKATGANHSVGTAITDEDDEKYRRKYQRVLKLTRDYA